MKLNSNKFSKFSSEACMSLLDYLNNDFIVFQKVIEYSFLNCAIKLKKSHFESGRLQECLLAFLDCDENIAKLCYSLDEYDSRVACKGYAGENECMVFHVNEDQDEIKDYLT